MSASLNRVCLLGNVTRDPELKYLPSGTAICDLGIAVNRSWTDRQTNEKKEEVLFCEVTYFGRIAEVAGQYLKKGRSVYCEGRLKLDTWIDKDSGQKRSKLKVIGESMQMLGGGQRQQSSDDQEYSQPEPAAPDPQPQWHNVPEIGQTPTTEKVPF